MQDLCTIICRYKFQIETHLAHAFTMSCLDITMPTKSILKIELMILYLNELKYPTPAFKALYKPGIYGTSKSGKSPRSGLYQQFWMAALSLHIQDLTCSTIRQRGWEVLNVQEEKVGRVMGIGFLV